MTEGNYLQFNQLYDKYGSQGLTILAFPSAQFMNQEPGKDGTEILHCLKYVRPGSGYVPKFTMMSKISVNGQAAPPLYQYLKSVCGPPNPILGYSGLINWDPVLIADITWNFEKFLIDKHGHPVRRYDPNTFPEMIEADIVNLLKQ